MAALSSSFSAAAATAPACTERNVTLLHSSSSSSWSKRSRVLCCNAAAAASNSSSSSSDQPRSDVWKTSGGYHPLEELSSSEKDDMDKARAGRLTDAETARTVAEVNTSAILLSPSLTNSNAVFGTEVTYLVDENGDIFFELADDNAVLQHSFVDPSCSFLIGFGEINELLASELLPVYESHLVSQTNSEEDSDSSYEDDDYYTSDDSESDDEDEEESFDPVPTPNEVHPMVFASKLSKVAASNIFQSIYKPSLRIALTGYVQSVKQDEEPYVRRKWEDRYLWEEDEEHSEEEEDDEEQSNETEDQSEEQPATSGSTDEDSDSLLVSEDESWSDANEAATSFYKFEIETIQLSSIIGAHASVDVKEFRYSEPDVLAHSAPDIIKNATSKKLKRALKSLCQREKCLSIEEASIIGVDSLGVDVRASCGLELKTLRFPFLRRARCVDTAQLLLHQVLYPRSRHRKGI